MAAADACPGFPTDIKAAFNVPTSFKILASVRASFLSSVAFHLHGGSAQTRSVAGAPTLCSGDDVSTRDPHCKVMLSGRTSHTRVESISFFVPNWICRVGMVI